jgi:hypothetical protein
VFSFCLSCADSESDTPSCKDDSDSPHFSHIKGESPVAVGGQTVGQQLRIVEDEHAFDSLHVLVVDDCIINLKVGIARSF